MVSYLTGNSFPSHPLKGNGVLCSLAREINDTSFNSVQEKALDEESSATFFYLS